MKLTKKLEAEILKVYNTVWDAYLRGDMRTFASILDENCYIIGSAAGEVFSNKKAAVKYYKSTAGQITGKAEFRNRKIKVMPVEKGFMVNEKADFYLLIDDQWTFYGPGRISSLFHKKNNKWKVIHQHGSFPDSKTEEGEQVNTDKIKAENIQLRNAVKRRTEELENKNRELEIESSLEKVRAQALGMHKPDDLLNVCRVLFKELGLLGFNDIRNAIIHTYNDEENYFIDYDYSDLTGGAITNISYNSHPVIKRFLKQIRSDEAFAEITIKGKELNEWKKFRKSGGQPDDPGLDKASALYYYFHSVGTGDIGISSFSSINEEKLQLLRRFRNVFDLAYKRYTDITKAEAQVREVQVEAALERVRSRSMAMHKSDDLHEVIKVVIEQLSLLSVKFNVANFAKINSDGSWDLWLSTPELTYPTLIHVPYLDHPIFNRITEEEAKGNDFYTDVYTRQETNIFFHHFFENTIAKNSPEERKQFVYSSKGLARSVFQTKNIWFSVGRYDITAFTDDENAIFKRFANVFEQAYTRFLDLQMAEAQARESEIELSLERVRAKTMAMQKPSEFVDVINIVGEQFVHLGFDIEWVNFGANGLDISRGIDIWNFAIIPGGDPVSARVFIPYFDHPLFINAVKELNKYHSTGNDLFILALSKDDKDSWLDHLFTKTVFKDVPEEYRAIQYAKTGYTTSNIALKDTWFSIGKFDPKPFTDEQNAILRRFAKAFGQAYTRFLDLQKAEAQAREAQIEAGLERVRSRAMAMQTSEELRELIGTVFTELTKLDIVLTRCLIMIYDHRSNDSVWWMANSEAPTQPIGLKVQYHEHPSYLAYVNAWKQKELKWTYTLEGNTKKEWDDFLFVETELSHLPDFVIAGMKAPDRVYLNASFNSFGNLTLATLEPLSDEHFDIMLRFAKVFDLTYTRFNDLKQAEAQAKEAKIEAALERVRARSMGMQKSDELAEVVAVLYKQFEELDFGLYQVLVSIYDKKKNLIEWWSRGFGEIELPQCNIIPIIDHPFSNDLFEKWEHGVEYYPHILEGELKQSWDEYLFTQTDLKNFPQEIKDTMRSFERVYLSDVFMKYGSLQAAGPAPLPDEKANILKRFVKALDHAYTRMKDLQNAEAQTREAQIELALERVRARTMAMHKSEELAETAQVLFQQLSELGGIPDRIAIGIADEVKGVVNFWTTDQQGSHLDHSFSARLNERTTIAKTYQAWKEQKRSLVVDLHGEELKEWIQFAREEMGITVMSDQIKDRRVHNLAFFSHGWILVTSHEPQSAETIQILERFASVFNLTYRRFLDLEKAEAQAREAQIEASLERVRGRTMAMQKSDELAETATLVFQQFSSLGLLPEGSRVFFSFIDEDTVTSEVWTTKEDGILRPGSHRISLKASRHLIDVYESWKGRKLIYNRELTGGELTDYLKYIVSVPYLKEDKTLQQLVIAPPDRLVFTEAIFAQGTIGVIGVIPLSQESQNTLMRFAKVFEQTYTRFLDLQKAEAQAREAQIEASLERVRASAMAMHRSDELSNVLAILFEQFDVLKIQPVDVHLDLFDLERNTFSYRATGKEGKRVIAEQIVDLNSRPEWQALLQKWKNGKPNTVDFSYYPKEVIKELMTFFPDIWAAMPEDAIMSPEDFPDGIFDALGYCKFGYIGFHHHRKATEEEERILIRFANEFERLYQRFLDLQKAEANAREAQIEVSLERVRAKAMAMHSSKDLAETLSVFYRELKSLSVIPIRCGVALMDNETRMAELTTMNTTGEGDSIEIIGKIKMAGHPVLDGVFENWLVQKEYHAVLRGNQIKEYYQVLKPQIDYLDYSHDVVQFGYYFMFKEGDVYAWTETELPEQDLEIYRRFTSVISLTYKRYKDLQQAEAQAKEAHIEAALERVRSKTMAMHNSQDVGETVATMFDQLVKLGVTTNRCGILIFSNTNNTEVWTAKSNPNGEATLIIGHLDVTIHPMLQGVRNAWKNKETFFSYELADDDIKNYYSSINNYPDYPTRFNLDSLPTKEIHSDFFFPEGAVFAFTSEPISSEASQIFKRFAGVFGQTYRRYLDLQKAEANARESQIEAGLERVRARTMAMHSSNDVGVATATMFTELEKLGIENLRGGITIIIPDQKQEVWSVTNMADGRTVRAIGVFDMKLHPLWRALLEGKERKEEYLYYWMAGKDKEDYINILNATPNYLAQPIKEFPDVHVQSYFFGEGAVWTNSLQPHSEEDKQVMKRFASVFSLTFRRYQDLKKAEAQAREATIEAALEKVRGKAMAMHNSNDLTATASLVFTELRKLGISPMRCGVGMLNKENRKALLYAAIASEEGDNLSQIGWVLLDTNPVLKNIYDTWIRGEDYFPVLKKEMLKAYYEHLKSGFVVPEEQTEYEHHGYFLPFSEGVFYGWAEKPFTGSEIKILKRFASVIDLTFRRYIELQKSEANAREAVKQAALDRVRAEIASMRTINDLDRITPLIWNELTILGIPFIRCGVFIMDDEQELIHTFLSTPDGKAIAAFHLPYDTPGNLAHVVTNWQKNKNYIDHWDEAEFLQFADILVKGGALVSAEQYLKTIPKGGFYLHFLPFLQGMLYVGNTDQLKEEEIELIQHVADAFSTAYARYEDFNKLESAKQQVEKTLTDLKQAQTQLVQSEKMASLGEMTAGIAHEIQNPLNFVNNFSEVSKELLDEMKAELETGNTEDAKDIANDVIQNLEKINHHGKRADAIVKSMLQHSRSSSGKKEPTDINALADEYLRLAYHGLRAKDKSFNAKFETEFDNNIGKVNIISQDIGRVLVNLINNAFYAVSERKKQETNGYEPIVTVVTKTVKPPLGGLGVIEIKVKDNGNGIPQKVLDKIFQPFFTTKPTGQGTGLGLSLAYDIITKGHGGELKVETKEGEGSEFIIQIPVSKTTES